MDLPATQRIQSDERLTRRSLLSGAVVWFLHLNTVYALPSLSCKWGWFPFTVGGISGLQFVETAITLIALLLLLVMIYLPWRQWRRFQTETPTDNPRMLQDTEKDRRSLLAFVAMLLNSIFLLFAIATFVPIFALNACSRG